MDDICGDAAFGEAPGVGAVVVEVVKVFVEVAFECCGARDQRACDRGAPALFEDGELEALDAAV